MATNTKIVLMDLADSWSPHTIDKLNYNFQSILAALNNKRGTSSGGSDITMADVDAEINSLVGDGTITLTQNGTFKGDFNVNQQGNKTIDLDAGGSSSISPYKLSPEMDGAGSPGESDDYARGDHVHPSDTTKANISDLATVATTGDYDDLTDKPNLAPVATSGLYSDLSGTPTLAAVATSGSYADLSNKPTIPAAGIPAGGIPGQVIGKVGGNDYDVAWVNQSGGGSADYTLSWTDITQDFINEDSDWENVQLLEILSDGHSVIASGVALGLPDSNGIIFNGSVPSDYLPPSDSVFYGLADSVTDATYSSVSTVSRASGSNNATVTVGSSEAAGGTRASYFSIIWPLAIPLGIAAATIAPVTKVLKGDGSGNAISVSINDLPHVAVNGSESLVFYTGDANVT